MLRQLQPLLDGVALRGETGGQPQREKDSGGDRNRACVGHGGLPQSQRKADNEKHVDGPGKVPFEEVEGPPILREGPQHRYLPIRADIENDVKQPAGNGKGVAAAPGGKLEREERKRQRDHRQAEERVSKDLVVFRPRFSS